MKQIAATATRPDTEPFSSNLKRDKALRVAGLKRSLSHKLEKRFSGELYDTLSPAVIREILTTTRARRSWELTAAETSRVRAMLLWGTLANDARGQDKRFPFDTFAARDVGHLPPGYCVPIYSTNERFGVSAHGIVSEIKIRRLPNGSLCVVACVWSKIKPGWFDEIEEPVQLPGDQPG